MSVGNADSLTFSKVLFPRQSRQMVANPMPTDVTRMLMADRRYLLGHPTLLIHTPSSYMPLAEEAHTDQAVCVRQS